MYRHVFTPTAANNLIPFTIPHEWYGKQVEFIVFPVTLDTPNEQDIDFWETLPQAEKEDIELGITQIANGEYVDYEFFMKGFRK